MGNIRDLIVRRRPSAPVEARASQAPAETERRASEAATPGEPNPHHGPAPDLDLARARIARDHVPAPANATLTGAGAKVRSVSAPEAQVGGVGPVSPEQLPRPKVWEIATTPSEAPVDVPVSAPREEVSTTDSGPLQKMSEGRGPFQGMHERRPASNRAKTRLLGFHGAAPVDDIFALDQAKRGGAETRFPIGWVVVVKGPGLGASFTLTAGLSTVGRDPGQTVCLDFGDSSISRENHVAIAYDEEDNCTFIGHGGKSNIVRHNGKPLLTTEKLNDGDLIRIGQTTLRFVMLCNEEFNWSEARDGDNADV